MIQYSWSLVHGSTIPLPNNLLYTTMTALRALIIFMIIIHELMSDQQKSRPYMHTTVHGSVCQITVGECQVMCLLVVSTLNYQLNVFFPWYVLMHKGGNKLNLNLLIAGLFLQETFTSTDTSCESVLTYTTLALVWEAQWRPRKQNERVRVKVCALNLA